MQTCLRQTRVVQWTLRPVTVVIVLCLLIGTFGPASVLLGSNAAAAGTPLYPDLKTTRPSGLYFDRVTMSDGLSHYVLRFSNTVWNDGEGRLELQGDPRPDGSSRVYQNIYDSPTAGTRVSQTHVTSDIVYHPSHYHYHFQGFASYLMLQRDSAGVYQATTKKGSKTSFCIMDSNHISSRGPSSAQYTSCNGSLQGISVGWGDRYQSSLPEQWIDVGTSRLADGYYAIQSTADPQNKLNEGGRDNNNVGLTYFRVSSGAITIITDPSAPSPSGRTGTITNSDGDNVNCRTQPSTSGAIITSLPEGSTVEVTGSLQNGWWPVICANRDGWIVSDYLTVTEGAPKNETRPEVVNLPGVQNPSFTGASLAASRSWGSSNGSGSPYVRDSRWSTAWYTVSNASSGHFVIDYGQVRQLTGVRWGFNATGNADQFVVDTSTDGQSWSRVDTFGNGQKNTWYGIGLDRQGRYVRVTFANPNGDAKVGYMAELQLWGTTTTAAPTPTPSPTPEVTNSPGIMSPSFSGSSLAAARSWGTSNGSGSPYARDGQWSTAWYTVSSPASGHFTIDYGQVYQLTGVRWGFNATGLADQFTIETSTDGQTWSHVGTFGNGPKFTWYGMELGQEGRYVRVTFANPNGDSRVGYMAEVQLWGTEASVSAAGLDTPTATPTATATPTPSPTATPTAPPSPTPTPAATATATPEPTATLTPTDVPTETPSPSPTPTVEPTATPEPTPAALPPTEEPAPTEAVETPITGQGFIDNPDAGAANCRIEPNESATILTEIPHGAEVVTVGDPVDGWQPVICDGQSGYVFADFIADTPPDQSIETPDATNLDDPALSATEDQQADSTGEETATAPEKADDPETTPESIPTEEPTAEPELVRQDIVVPASGDTSVRQGEPDSPQSGDATASLPIGGEAGAVAVLTFEVDGVDERTVVEARLFLTGTGDTAGAGGNLTVLPGVWLDESSTTWNDVSALGGQTVGWVDWIEPGVETGIDISGVVTADGALTFVIEGTPDQIVAIASSESGAPPYIMLTIETPSGGTLP